MIKYSMPIDCVRVTCEIHFKSNQLPMWYRLYVNDEMFVERTADLCANQFIQETITLSAEAGRYLVWLRGEHRANCSIKNIKVVEGTASIDQDQYIVIE